MRLLFVLVTAFVALAAQAQMVPFVLPWNDAAPGAADFSGLNTPIGPSTRVTVDTAGRFQAGGKRIRFLGVNMASDSPFMPTNKAEGVAGRMAKFGINCVRLHHIDPPWAAGGGVIQYTSTSSRQINASQLERIHFLVSRLKAHGVYSDINLLTAREFRSGDGLGTAVTSLGWKEQHILAFFNDSALNLQKEFATRLLTPVNRFTGLSLAADPAVALIEVLNENGMFQKWYDGSVDALPSTFALQLQSRWNDWLAQRYANDEALRAAWAASDAPLGPNLLKNGNFASGTTSWNLEQHNGAVAGAVKTSEFNGGPSLKLTVTRAGTEPWHVQYNQSGLRLTDGAVYTLTFSARASAAQQLDASVMMAHDPWQTLGYSEGVPLTADWQTFTRTFAATRTDTSVRVNFAGMGNRLVTVWLGDVRLQTGGQLGAIPDGVSLAARNIPSVRHTGDGFTGPPNARRDWIRFLRELENRYYDEMVAHLRTSVGYPGLIFGTLATTSPAGVQTRLDAVDAHAYWQHPVFPGVEWDSVNWTVRNVSMLNTAPASTTLAGLMRLRVKGKPFLVSEYQHSSPNSFGAEGPLLLAAYAGLQDWDGLWLFDYGWGNDATHEGVPNPTGRFRGFFDTGQHPTKMANVMLAAALFRRGDVAPATREYTFAITPESEIELLLKRAAAWNVYSGSQLDIPGALGFVSRVMIDYGANATGLPTPPPAPTTFASDTGELRWVSSTSAGYLTIHTPRTRAAAGFIADRTVALGDVEIQAGAGMLRWATVGLTLVEGTSFADGGRALLIATGNCENTGQTWRTAAKENVSSWGVAPSLVEVVPLRLTLPAGVDRVSAWALDERGQRSAPAMIVAGDAGRAQLVTRLEDATLWYEIEIQPAAGTTFDAWRQTQFTAAELASPAISGESAAPAGDGVPNLLKFALGIPAKIPAAPADLPQWGVGDTGANRMLWLEYTRLKDAVDVRLVPFSSTGLPAWSAAPETIVSDDGTRVRVRSEHPMAPGAPALGLLKLELQRSPATPGEK